MKTTFETEIVQTKQPKKLFLWIYFTFYSFAVVYIFFWTDGSKNAYLEASAYLIYAGGFFLMSAHFLIKPKRIGYLSISSEGIEFQHNNDTKSFDLEAVENVFLKYQDYGSWKTHSIFGNKNHIIITTKEGKRFAFEILIENKSVKDQFKQIVLQPEFHGKFDMIQVINSKTKF